MFEIAKCPVCGAREWHDTAAYPPYRWACAKCYALAFFICPDGELFTFERRAAPTSTAEHGK